MSSMKGIDYINLAAAAIQLGSTLIEQGNRAPTEEEEAEINAKFLSARERAQASADRREAAGD